MRCELLTEWDDLLEDFPPDKKDIYFSKRYIGLYENDKNRAFCAVYCEDDKTMLMPFLRGEIDGFYDFETAYGYGGPVSNSEDPAWNQRAFECIYDLLKENHYLCGFVRFHPLMNNEMIATGGEGHRINVLYDRQTIAIDTSRETEEIWSKQISSKNRNMIRKAERNGLEYATECDFASYDEFIELYNATMKRLSADGFYFFNMDYYTRLKEALSRNSFLGTVRKDGKLICAAIFMYSEVYGHYHLEGSDRHYSSLGANNLLLWKVACKMHDMGIKQFHLGGGTGSSPNDPLYKFKKAFSGNEKRFFIGKEVFRESDYSRISDEWVAKNPEKAAIYGNRLLKYRY